MNAISTDNQPLQLADISIPLTTGRSLVTDALLNKQANQSFSSESIEYDASKLSIIDRQLVGITGQEGIICLPMMINNAAIGTLVLGVDKTQYESLWKQLTLLTRFVNEVAHTISANYTSIEVRYQYQCSHQSAGTENSRSIT